MRGPTCAPYRCGVKAVGGYILKRLSIGIPKLLIIVTASFFLMRAAPGGPFDAEVDLAPLFRANLEARYGLDQPLGTQYLRFLDGRKSGRATGRGKGWQAGWKRGGAD